MYAKWYVSEMSPSGCDYRRKGHLQNSHCDPEIRVEFRNVARITIYTEQTDTLTVMKQGSIHSRTSNSGIVHRCVSWEQSW